MFLTLAATSLLPIVIVLLVVGLGLFLVNKYWPMDGKIKTIINWTVVIVVIVWLLRAFGLLSYLKDISV